MPPIVDEKQLLAAYVQAHTQRGIEHGADRCQLCQSLLERGVRCRHLRIIDPGVQCNDVAVKRSQNIGQDLSCGSKCIIHHQIEFRTTDCLDINSLQEFPDIRFLHCCRILDCADLIQIDPAEILTEIYALVFRSTDLLSCFLFRRRTNIDRPLIEWRKTHMDSTLRPEVTGHEACNGDGRAA